MSRLLGALGQSCADHHRGVLATWLLLAAGLIVALVTLGPETNNDFSLPGTDSQAATDLLGTEFPPEQNGASPIVFHVDSGKLTNSTDTDAIQQSVAAIRRFPHVFSASDPTANPSAGLISGNGRTAFSSVLLDVDSGQVTTEIAQAVVDATAPAQNAGIEVEAGGSIGSTLSSSESEIPELIGILAAIVILTFTFGSVVAMGMPIVMAITGLIVGLGTVGMLGYIINIPSTGTTLATMIGLGVGIDYALFLVTRHRDNLRAGMPIRDSIAMAVATSGSAIVFAGGTVVIALLSLSVAGIPIVSALGYATAVAVFTAVAAAITFLPALLSVVDHRINALRLPRWLHPAPKPEGHGFWAGWAFLVTRYRRTAVLVALGILIPLAVPLLSLRLGQEDIGVTPEDTTERKAFDLLSEGFGPGYNGPLLVAVSLDPPATPGPEYTAQYNLATALSADLTNKQTQLTDNANALEKQQNQLENQKAGLESQADDLEQEKTGLEAEQAQLEQEADSLRNSRAGLQAEQRELERDVDAFEARAVALRRRGAARHDRRASLARRALGVHQERNAVLTRWRLLPLDADQLVLRLEQLRRRRAEPTAEIQQLRAIIADPTTTPEDRAAARTRLMVVEAAFERTRNAISETRAALQNVREEARRTLDKGRALLDDARALEQRADGLQQRADGLGRRAGSAVQNAASLARQAVGLERQRVRLLVQAAELAAEGEELTQQADELQQQGDELQKDGNQLEKKAARLQTQADQLQQEKADTEAEGDQAEALQTQLTNTLTAAAGDNRGTDPRLAALKSVLATPGDVTLVSPANISSSGAAATFTVVPDSRPAAPRTADLVVQMRESLIPPALGAGVVAHVGGSTAANVDLANRIARRMPLVIATILALSFVLLTIAFRSLLIPVQAAVTNLLSAAASFGVLTACFQWGWGLGLVGLPSPYGTVPIASFVPLMMFATLFGLSMDYEVFFASQVQRHHVEGDPIWTAVRRGLANSARVIVAAATIMISVFAAFILEADPTIKQFGVGLSVAVLLAGTMVILLAPAMLALFGERTFWLPRWLDRILPNVDLEGPPPTVPAPVPAEQLAPAVTAGASAGGSTRGLPPAVTERVDQLPDDAWFADATEASELPPRDSAPRHGRGQTGGADPAD